MYIDHTATGPLVQTLVKKMEIQEIQTYIPTHMHAGTLNTS